MSRVNNSGVGREIGRAKTVVMRPCVAVDANGGTSRLKHLLLASVALVSAGTSFAAAETINNTTRTITTPTTYPGNLFVATTGTATLTIKDGGTVYHPKYGDVGQYAGSSGTVVVTGTGSQWNSGGSITVGDAGVGTMTVEKGGVVSDTVGYIGYTKGGSGTVTVDGPGSQWTNSGNLYVGGLYGSGTLSIQNGGLVNAGTTAGYTSIGFSATSVGTLTVTGGGSTFNSNGQLGVGSLGNGTLNVEKGGSVTATLGVIGTQAGSTGTATVTDKGSSWTNSSALYVGYGGTGTLNVENGGAVSNTNVGKIGVQAGSVGSVLVTDRGSTWTNSRSLTVGDAGAGTLSIENGGSVEDTTGTVGNLAGGTGTVTVTGRGSAWTNSSGLIVGVNGNGELNVKNGGTVSNADVGVIGQTAGVGSVLVTDRGSTWTNSTTLTVGDAGTGTLSIENGGSVEDTTGTVGNSAGGSGTATVTGRGSSWINSSGLTVGANGKGELDVLNGGTVSNTDRAYIGYGLGGQGTAMVNGAGSNWISDSLIYVGFAGTGELNIQNRGTVNDTEGRIGQEAGGTGTVNVTGIGSQWINGSYLTVGYSGQGELAVANGASVSSLDGYIGYKSGSSGTVTVDGSRSSWTARGGMMVGEEGEGTLYIKNGGSVSNVDGYVGYYSGENAIGRVEVRGAGSQWTNSGDLYVGVSGEGNLTIANGGTVSASSVTLAADEGSFGVLTIGAGSSSEERAAPGTLDTPSLVFGEGTGELYFNHVSGNYEFSPDMSGDGYIAAMSGRTVLLGDSSGFSGGTDIYSGAMLAIGNGGVKGYLGGNIFVAGTLVFDRADAVTYDGSIYDGIEVAGDVVKDGAGKLTLTGDSRYFSGSTWVTQGTLAVNGTLGDSKSNVYVTEGGILGGSGTIGGSVAIGDGVLAPGNSAGTLTIDGNLTLSKKSVLDYELGQSGSVGGAYNDLTVVHGDLVLDGTINVAQSAGGTYDTGIYRVISYDGALTDNGLDIGTMPNGSVNYVQTSVANQVNLVNSQGLTLNFWDGANGTRNSGTIEGGSGTWTVASSGAQSDNWTTADGALNAPFSNGSFAVFTGTPGAVTVDNTAGQVQVSGMQFAVDGYAVDGGAIELLAGSDAIRVGDGTSDGAGMTATIASALTGNGSLNKTDLGTLVLAGANTYTGGTTITAGTLTGSATSFGSGAIVDNAALVLAQDADGTLANTISGSGTVTKTGAGNLTLAPVNSYAGGTTVSAGSLTGSATSFGSGSIADNAALVLDQGSDATLANTISGSGTVTKTGSGNLTLAAANSYAGGTLINGGTLTGSATSFGSGMITDNAALVLDQGANATLANVLSGTGSLTKAGAGQLDLTGNSAGFTGATTIAAGELKVNGVIGSVVTALAGTTLSGAGTVGGVVAEAGSVVAPGNSPGTLTVAGNYLQQAGSTYAAQVVPGTSTSDEIAVGGAATIANGAVLNVSKSGGGSYTIDSHYKVLTAAGGVSGAYQVTGDTDISTFYDLMATYDANGVYLNAVQTRSFVDAGTTPNQRAVAAGLQSLAGTNALRYAIGSLASDLQAQAAYNGLSGEMYASIQGAMIEDSFFLRGGAVDRVRAAFGGVGASSANVVSCGKTSEPGQTKASLAVNCPAVWAQGYGSWGNTDGDGNAAGLSNNIGGFMVGADETVFDTWRIGVLGGYGRSNYDVADRNSSGSADNYSIGVYGGTQWDKFGLRLGTTYTWSDVDTSRSVAFPGFAGSFSNAYQAGTAQVFGDLGYRMDAGPVAFEPFAGLAYVNVNTNGFTEQGGLGALTAPSDDSSVTFSTLGLRAASSFVAAGLNVTASGTLGWRHAWGDVTPTSTFTLSGSDPFSIAGVAVATDAALVNAGLTAALSRDVSLDLFYNGQFGDGVQLQGVSGTVAVKF